MLLVKVQKIRDCIYTTPAQDSGIIVAKSAKRIREPEAVDDYKESSAFWTQQGY